MASAPRPSSRPRHTWRERSRPSATTAEARLIKRWFWSLLFIVLVAALAWLIWRYLFMPSTYFAHLSVTEYKKHEAPPVPFFENDARFFDGTIKSERLNNAETVASMKQLAASLDRIVSRTRDSLVLYVSAHGASFKSGGNFDGYLLCADFDSFKSEGDRGIVRGYLKVTDFLQEVRNSQAGLKIVILDAGHLPTEPRLGVMVNEFPDRLAEAVKQTGDQNLWVLSANSTHESSHVAHASHRSVFGYLVVRGLAGDADVKPADGVVDLAELTTFVCGGVRDWMNRQYGELESQTPQILWGGGDITPAVVEARMSAIELPVVKLCRPPMKKGPPDNHATRPPSKPTRRGPPPDVPGPCGRGNWPGSRPGKACWLSAAERHLPLRARRQRRTQPKRQRRSQIQSPWRRRAPPSNPKNQHRMPGARRRMPANQTLHRLPYRRRQKRRTRSSLSARRRKRRRHRIRGACCARPGWSATDALSRKAKVDGRRSTTRLGFGGVTRA